MTNFNHIPLYMGYGAIGAELRRFFNLLFIDDEATALTLIGHLFFPLNLSLFCHVGHLLSLAKLLLVYIN